MPVRFAKEGVSVSALSAAALSATNGPPALPTLPLDRLRELRRSVAVEGQAVLAASELIGTSAVRAAELTARCEGSIIVTGVGKAGLVGQKLVATLASTGSPAHFLHPAEAAHGDLGRVRRSDLIWAISNSGRSEEVLRIAPHLRQYGSGLIAITATERNPLADLADCVVAVGKHSEACPHGLAPTVSTTVMLAVGDAIAMFASRLRGFTAQDFARFHPGGALGRKLSSVTELMRPLSHCRIANADVSVRAAMVACGRHGRRSGAVMLVDERRKLVGIFTDSDLARLLEQRDDGAFDEPISSRMTVQPATASQQTSLQQAVAMMSHRRISELPVVDADHRPVGLLDITDVVSQTDPLAFSRVPVL